VPHTNPKPSDTAKSTDPYESRLITFPWVIVVFFGIAIYGIIPLATKHLTLPIS
jgi:hypothetical protein